MKQTSAATLLRRSAESLEGGILVPPASLPLTGMPEEERIRQLWTEPQTGRRTILPPFIRRCAFHLLLIASGAVPLGAHPLTPEAPPPSPGIAGGTAPSQEAPTPGDEPAPAVQPSLPEEAERYRVYLLTVGQGSEVWELFGHNALLIVDNLTGEQLAWNWGLFNFDDDGFLLRFLRGTMRYTMGPFDADRFVNSYAGTDRVVYANEVFLSQEEAAELDAYVRTNYLPENRPYIYQYFRDNCSTRVRDALDSVLGGDLEAEFSGNLTERSYRWHARRLVQIEGWVDQGLSFLLGIRGDRPITEWEAMFAPLELLDLLEGVEREGEEGEIRPLLGPRVTLLPSPRSEVPAGPTALSPLWAVLGLLLGVALAAIARSAAQGSRWARSAMLAGAAMWGLFSGVLGLLLLLSWLTDHEFIRWNLNIFHLSPVGLVLAAASLTLLLRGGKDATTAGRIALTSSQWIAVGAFLAALLQTTPFLAQGNAEVLLLSLPVNLSVAWGIRTLARPAGDRSTKFAAKPVVPSPSGG